ncbi:hypothetical protein PPL_12058 [Heterostelium album PN500]|uniref:Ankyrin repeat protein n=1 Tax=Heterostelium pallidum (strain ATCC 26659 / Pp 5 / PN500) TaxID=670386 RepID=D3BLK5_HETP5|nr:hypothetical protein PPL_12058 [Heterostelium album PN500]EFA77456.1 hypothetical protein PPL_12058 [Heterostelium album PN500]|eukprot:XP_020429584.1 hypothetical protein PPL_12058 [Heterostelium album PN500]
MVILPAQEVDRMNYLDIIFQGTEGCNREAMDQAARGGHFSILKWLHENRTEGFSFDAFYNIIEYGHQLEIFEWLYDHREINSDDFQFFIERVVEYGRIEIFKFLLSKKREYNATHFIYNTITNSNLEMVKYIYENGIDDNLDKDLFGLAVDNNDDDILKYILEKIDGTISLDIDQAIISSISRHQLGRPSSALLILSSRAVLVGGTARYSWKLKSHRERAPNLSKHNIASLGPNGIMVRYSLPCCQLQDILTIDQRVDDFGESMDKQVLI